MTALTPPPERDIPPVLRARVLDTVAAPTTPPARHWIPVAAAAAVAVAVALPVTVLAGRTDPTGRPTVGATGGSAAAPAGWTRPDDATIVSRCLARVTGPVAVDGRDVVVRAVSVHGSGYVAWIGGGGSSAVCSFLWDDDAILSAGPAVGQPDPDWSADTVTGLTLDGVGGTEDIRIVSGTVARDVTRVVARWGTTTADLAVRERYLVGRVDAPDGGTDGRPTVQAYRSDGSAYSPAPVPGNRSAPGPQDAQIVLPASPLEPVEVPDALVAKALRGCDLGTPRARPLATVRTATGYLTAVATGRHMSACSWTGGGELERGYGQVSPDTGAYGPLSAPVTYGGLGDGGDGAWAFYGKASAGVRRVTLTFGDGRILEARVAKGSWVTAVGGNGLRFVDDPTAPEEASDVPSTRVAKPVVRAYGEGGELLYDSTRGDVSCPQGCTYPWP